MATGRQAPEQTWLVGDVGGTNARFALCDGPGAEPRAALALACDDYLDLAAAAEAYLSNHDATRPTHGCIAVAGPVGGDQVALTNNAWSFSIEATRLRLGLGRLLIVNDFTAQALSVPSLGPEGLAKIGGGAAVAGAAIAVIGPGTGLGVSGLLPVAGRWVALPGEGGHLGFAPSDETETEILDLLRRRFGRVSCERLISGPGLAILHQALSALADQPAEPLAPDQIVERALAGTDPLCLDVLERFCAVLGTVAGDVALALGARGGVYIAGGIVPRFLEFFRASQFRPRFEAKGRLGDYTGAIPTSVITVAMPALTGTARALEQALSESG
jgi:glucokinase